MPRTSTMVEPVSIPVNVQIHPGHPIEPVIHWAYTTRFPEREPRFDLWVQRHGFDRDGGLVTRTLEAAEAQIAATPRIAPTGFIFHMSRCGSTLVANLLSTMPATCVISEAQPLHALLGAWQGEDKLTLRDRLLKVLVAGLAPPQSANHRFLFIKFVSSDIFAFELIRRSFPEVPWLFLCREPVEVMVSALHSPPGWLYYWESYNWQTRLHLADAELADSSNVAQRCAEMLRAFLSTAIAQGVTDGLLVSYNELPAVAMSKILTHFKLPTSEAIIQAMLAEATYYAKDDRRTERFTPDSQRKQTAASPLIQHLVDDMLRPLYEQLLRTYSQTR